MNVWLYHRTSTPTDPDIIQAAFDRLRHSAEAKGHHVVGQSYDCGSWENLDREGLRQGVDAVTKKTADAIYSIKLNRIARNMDTVSAFLKQLPSPKALLLESTTDQELIDPLILTMLEQMKLTAE